MNDFKDIKSKWVHRSIPEIPKDGYKEIIKTSLYIRRRQLIGQVVLTVTVIILVYFFFYISAFKNTRLTLGLLLMIGSLLLRIGIESFSKAKFKKLTPTLRVKEFGEKTIAYYKSRLLIHYIFTPLLFISYIIGFISLLPLFKLNLSPGFYNYIIISSIPIFIFLIVLIYVNTKKELKMINQMKKDIAIDQLAIQQPIRQVDKPNTAS